MKRPPLGSGRTPAAFTVLELLVVICLTAILFLLVWAGGRSARQMVQTAGCTNHLRQSGAAMLAYAGDHGGVINLYAYRTASTSVEWLRYLTGRVDGDHNRKNGDGASNSSYLSNPDAALCPAFKPFKYPSGGSNRIYGASTRLASDPASSSPPGTGESSRQVHLNRIEQPSRYWLLVDSYHEGHEEQIYVVSNTLSGQFGIHFRHHGRAGMLFADGHVAMMTPADASKLPVYPFTAGFTEECQRMKIPSSP